MYLSDRQIRLARAQGSIVIDPWNDRALGPNSYDVRLSPHITVYRELRDAWHRPLPLDVKEEPLVDEYTIQDSGFVLKPGELYLGSTVEYTESHKFLPFLDGKSSIGRLGIIIHCTAGRGDVGFCGHWTMEIFVVRPIRIYAGMPIGQLSFAECGDPTVSYDKRVGSKYMNKDPKPQPSQMWRNFNR